MLELYIKTTGVLFQHIKSGKIYRTPIKLLIENDEKSLYESLIKKTPITNYEFTNVDNINTKAKNREITLKEMHCGYTDDIKIAGLIKG